MQRGKGLKAIAFEWDQASLIVNELFCMFGKEGDLIRHVIIQVFFTNGKIQGYLYEERVWNPKESLYCVRSNLMGQGLLSE